MQLVITLIYFHSPSSSLTNSQHSLPTCEKAEASFFLEATKFKSWVYNVKADLKLRAKETDTNQIKRLCLSSLKAQITNEEQEIAES